ncbi:hypothetical protein RUM43_009880 [Polyplax serrata]|uniref:Cytochrome c oxidase assembly protein COX20, mitochondrial n=1 Tax=Polyplax serrata TaxID=468196 RepID=A0AAN8RZY7_POLSC
MGDIEEDVNGPFVGEPVMFLGRDLRKIACFRNSFIFGISTGIASGLITFMFTSKPRFSTHTAFGMLWLGVFGYWVPCRIKFESKRASQIDMSIRNLRNLTSTPLK